MRIVISCTLLFLVLTPSPAAISEESIDEQAKAVFNQGRGSFHSANYAEAAKAFREAYHLKLSWKLLYNIGQAEAAGKQYGLALEAFELYLAEGGDEVDQKRQDQVQKEILRLKGMVGFLSVKAPDGSAILIDEVERGITPLPGRIRISAGVMHRMVVRRGDEVLVDRSVRLGSGESEIIEVETRELSEGPEPETQKTEAQEPEENSGLFSNKNEQGRLRPLGWSLVGVGVAVAAAGGVTGALSLSKSRELDESCQDNLCPDELNDTHSSATGLATVANILLPVGGAMAIAGLVMVIAGRNEKDVDTNVAVLPGLSGLSIRGEF